MNPDDPKKIRIIDELQSIREALHKQQAPAVQEEIPLLEEIIEESSEDNEPYIPILAEVVLMPDSEVNELAQSSWSLIDTSLKHWSQTLPEPVASLSKKLLVSMKDQLSSNWEAGFCKQSEQQLEQWKTWLSETLVTLDTPIDIDLPKK